MDRMIEAQEQEKRLLRGQLKGVEMQRNDLLAQRVFLEGLIEAVTAEGGPAEQPTEADGLQQQLLQNVADVHALGQRLEFIQNQLWALRRKEEQTSPAHLRTQLQEHMDSYDQACSDGCSSDDTDDDGMKGCGSSDCSHGWVLVGTEPDSDDSDDQLMAASDSSGRSSSREAELGWHCMAGATEAREAAAGVKRKRTNTPPPELLMCTICQEPSPCTAMLSAGFPSPLNAATQTPTAMDASAALAPATPTPAAPGAASSSSIFASPYSGAAGTSSASAACWPSTSCATSCAAETSCGPSPSTATAPSSLGSPVALTGTSVWAPCRHYCCHNCTQQYARHEIRAHKYPVGCPMPGCGATLDNACLPSLMGRYYDFQALQECEVLHALSAEERLYCPHNACSALLLRPAILAPNTPSTCPSCRGTFCATCLVAGWHEGFTCKDFQALPPGQRSAEDTAFLQLALRRRWRACPSCGMMVERGEGCSHVTCRCGSEFCYSCGKQYQAVLEAAPNTRQEYWAPDQGELQEDVTPRPEAEAVPVEEDNGGAACGTQRQHQAQHQEAETPRQEAGAAPAESSGEAGGRVRWRRACQCSG